MNSTEQSAYSKVIDQHSEAITGISERVDLLLGRLQCLLRPARESTSADVAAPSDESSSPAVEKIAAMTRRLNDSTNVLDEMIRRLDT